jgi:hypothetical protein
MRAAVSECFSRHAEAERKREQAQQAESVKKHR